MQGRREGHRRRLRNLETISIETAIGSRREKKEPIAYILNKKEFWSTNFIVDKNVATLWKIPTAENIFVLDAGEKNKNLSSVAQIKLHEERFGK